MSSTLPPYGIEPAVWERIRELAAAAVASMDEGADEEAVARDARGLRNLLRDLV